MNDLATITLVGRVTADLTLKTSQNGKNTKYIQFGFAVNKGYGEHAHPNFYSCVIYGESAQRMLDAKVKKGSLLNITGDLDLVEFTRQDGTHGMMPKVTLYGWNYVSGTKPKTDDSEEPDEDYEDDAGYAETNLEDEELPYS